jgi:glycosyltransferase involved in cell wall biosynthesis
MNNSKEIDLHAAAEPMKVILSMQSFELGGSERRYYNVARHLSKDSRIEMTLVITGAVLDKLIPAQGEPPPELKVVRIFDCGWRRWLSKIASFRTRSALLNRFLNASFFRLRVRFLHWFSKVFDVSEYDVWHCCGRGGRPGFPKHYTRHALMVCADTEVAVPGHALSDSIFRNAVLDGRIMEVISDTVRKAIINKLELDAEGAKSLALAPCSFIDYERIGVSGNDERKYVSFLGRFHREKNPLVFARAIGAIASEFPEVKFLMMGHGPFETKIRNEIEFMGIVDRVEIRAELNPIKYLKRSLIFVSIQNRDNYSSQALMEAMACGCAIIASDVGLTAQLIPDGIGVRIPLSAEKLADNLRYLLNDQQKMERLGIAASEFVRETQTIERYGEFLIGLYRQVARS